MPLCFGEASAGTGVQCACASLSVCLSISLSVDEIRLLMSSTEQRNQQVKGKASWTDQRSDGMRDLLINIETFIYYGYLSCYRTCRATLIQYDFLCSNGVTRNA